MRLVLPVALTLALTACGSPAALPLQTTSGPSVKAQDADDFLDLQGQMVSLSEEIGHPVVLMFVTPGDWNSEAEVPQLIRLSSAYAADGVRFVAVGENASAAELARWAQQNQLDFSVWQDPTGLGLASRGFAGVPDTQFIARTGAVARSEAGFLARGQLLEGLALID